MRGWVLRNHLLNKGVQYIEHSCHSRLPVAICQLERELLRADPLC